MLKLRRFSRRDSAAVALLIMQTYKKFNSREFFRRSAVEDYISRYDPARNSVSQLNEMFGRTPIFFVAVDNGKIVGMVRGRKDRVINLFVDARQHRKGIGRMLMNKFESEARVQSSREIRIRASLYATLFYQKVGYKKTTGIRNFHGLKIYPMRKTLAR